MARHTMRPGALRHTLYLQETTKSYGNAGTWANVDDMPEIRCQIETIASTETVGGSGERGERRVRVTLRYRSDVGYENRLYDGTSRAYDIVHINNVDEMDKKLVLEVVERRA